MSTFYTFCRSCQAEIGSAHEMHLENYSGENIASAVCGECYAEIKGAGKCNRCHGKGFVDECSGGDWETIPCPVCDDGDWDGEQFVGSWRDKVVTNAAALKTEDAIADAVADHTGGRSV